MSVLWLNTEDNIETAPWAFCLRLSSDFISFKVQLTKFAPVHVFGCFFLFPSSMFRTLLHSHIHDISVVMLSSYSITPLVYVYLLCVFFYIVCSYLNFLCPPFTCSTCFSCNDPLDWSNQGATKCARPCEHERQLWSTAGDILLEDSLYPAVEHQPAATEARGQAHPEPPPGCKVSVCAPILWTGPWNTGKSALSQLIINI